VHFRVPARSWSPSIGAATTSDAATTARDAKIPAIRTYPKGFIAIAPRYRIARFQPVFLIVFSARFEVASMQNDGAAFFARTHTVLRSTLMKRNLRLGLSLAVLIVSSFFGSSGLAMAQTYHPYAIPSYSTWQAQWDQDQYDRRHVILGMVVGFQPYRLQVQRRDGFVQGLDLKNGTVILPTGATPTPGERVAVVGYYSRGTFIVNRLIIR
jgi:hypothetical protein